MKVNVRNFHTLTILSSCHCQAPKLSFAKWLLTRQYKSGYRGYKTIHLDTHVQILPSTYYLVGRYPIVRICWNLDSPIVLHIRTMARLLFQIWCKICVGSVYFSTYCNLYQSNAYFSVASTFLYTK